MSYPPISTADVQMGIPLDGSTIGHGHDPRVERERSTGYLKSNGMPEGLNQAFLQTCTDFPLRIWVIDNSGSMQTQDGKRIVYGPGGREGVVESSRWAELGDSLIWHAKLAAHLGAPTEFRLLNPPGFSVPQVLSVGLGGDLQVEVAQVERLITTGPTGRTPLCEQIRQVVERIKPQAAYLRASGQKVSIVIASDGAATDGNIEEAMKPLQALPVWIVVRLCTDDEKVVQYWNEIDEELELDMDVIDDLSGEAAEVAEHNGWLTYSAQLHRLREWGCQHKVLDVLDEKTLGVSEMKGLIELILGQSALDLPNPQLDYNGFEEALKGVLAQSKDVWDPLRNRKCPWFDVRKLRKTYDKGVSAGGCNCVIA
mmetsp:Transcript_53553/g.106570  ORF Transcript_53553/g.106570 Transcript_53553/m.106570 type:complete len:369 (-) Transcript_53553:347-1453(-)